MLKIKRALISVSDKTGLLDLVKELIKYNVEILSTGGTARLLRDNGIPVKEVSEYTGFPEMLDGRVKTLHPKIHAGLLALRDNQEHMDTLLKHNINLIDLVVVNLYPFEKTVQKPAVKLEEAIENIDIGGPAMLRSAAKNYSSVAVVCNPKYYPEIIQELRKNNGGISEDLRFKLALEAFRLTSYYDRMIYDYLNRQGKNTSAESLAFPEDLVLRFKKIQNLRYGENPHQKAAFYKEEDRESGLVLMRQVWGKELSFNNILDLNAAVNIIKEFTDPAVVFIKHNNPCGVAENKDLKKAYQQAFNCDRLSAFGGIVGINRKVDLNLAHLIYRSGFLECVIGLGFTKEALDLLKKKKNLRILELPNLLASSGGLDFKKIEGGLLLQDEDRLTLDEDNLKVVTKLKPTKKQLQSLIFAWKVVKHVKSNAIVLAKGTKTIGIGAGQMSRVDAVFIALKKAGDSAKNSVLASDAFFPKEDAIQLSARFKIKAIIQPGGSVADERIISLADKYKIAMVFTGIRHFRH
ncbi:MAG: bifunctional phosphoribosylaminoimidazolecarboxamide formyltransferase/IMP cyclohydrolase [Candidatus Omnitrophica bacterium]|nr:bifunctional phosphoribosylaminoimidazolecarboxamide formyltransferase/IMP cyclohydrolase [Candidatus Omnitrophota bacterium]